MDAFRKKQAELKKLREEEAAKAAGGASEPAATPAAEPAASTAASTSAQTEAASAASDKPLSAAERFRSLKRSESTPASSA